MVSLVEMRRIVAQWMSHYVSQWSEDRVQRQGRYFLAHVWGWTHDQWAWALAENKTFSLAEVQRLCPLLFWMITHGPTEVPPISLMQMERGAMRLSTCFSASSSNSSEISSCSWGPMPPLGFIQAEHMTSAHHALEFWLQAPLSRFFGFGYFLGKKFYLNQETLDPRWETEELVHLACQKIRARSPKQPRILDLGTGSGCILLSILHKELRAQGVGVDISFAALTAARYNSALHGLSPRCSWRVSCWFRDFSKAFHNLFDVIVSNPPYVSAPGKKEHFEGLSLFAHVHGDVSQEVHMWDPAGALYAGCDGLEAYKEIIASAEKFLCPGGALILEIGCHQKENVCSLLQEASFVNIIPLKDEAGLWRYVSGEKALSSKKNTF